MARTERSAGIIAYRKEPAAPGGRAYLLLDYGRYWEYAKGHVEKGEDDLTAAVRELREETGIADVRPIDGFAHEIRYFFRDRKEGLVQKTVVFFLAETAATTLQISHEHAGGGFFPYEEAMRLLSYANSRQVLRLAHDYLDRLA